MFLLLLPSILIAAPAKKWQPGYYFEATLEHMTEAKWQERVVKTGMKGASVRFKWRALETAKDQYDFTELRNQLIRAKRDGKYIGLHVEDRNWNDSSSPGKCVPDYMMTPEYGGGQMTRTVVINGTNRMQCTSARWNAATMGRYIALMQALAKEFDSNPNFVWVQTTETANSMGPQLTNAMRTDMHNQFYRLADAMGQAWVTTTWGMSVNWDTGDIPTLLNRIMNAGGGISWPDTIPISCRQPVTNASCHRTPIYNYIDQYKNRMMIAPNIEMTFLTGQDHIIRDKWDCGGHPCTWLDVHNQTILWGSNMVQWQPDGWGETAATHFNFIRDLLPILKSTNYKVNDTCPSNITCMTSTAPAKPSTPVNLKFQQ